MPIVKTFITPAGATVGYHRLRNFTFNPNALPAIAQYEGWVDEAAYIAGKNLVWNASIPVALGPLTGSDLAASIDRACALEGDFAGGTVVADNRDTLDGVKTRKVASLSESCRAQIMAGFTSPALGAAYLYPAKPPDQSNLTGSVLASLLPGNAANWITPFWCADDLGVWAFRMHTAAQIQTVGMDAKSSLLAALGKNEQLASQVKSAIDMATVAAVAW